MPTGQDNPHPEFPDYGNALKILSDVCRDPQVPKGVKKKIEEVSAKLLSRDRPLQVKINSCTYLLDEISNDPSVPPHTRTFVWQIAGLLESVGKRAQLKVQATQQAGPVTAPSAKR